ALRTERAERAKLAKRRARGREHGCVGGAGVERPPDSAAREPVVRVEQRVARRERQPFAQERRAVERNARALYDRARRVGVERQRSAERCELPAYETRAALEVDVRLDA